MVLTRLAAPISGVSVPVLHGLSEPVTLTPSRPEIAMRAFGSSEQRSDFPANAPAANPVFYRTYSRRTAAGRESWSQVRARNLEGLRQLGLLSDTEVDLMARMQAEKKALPSGRWLWIGGTDWINKEENFSGAYNCTSTNLVDWEAFGLMMDLAMMGCGTGAVIEPHLIKKLPVVCNPITIKSITDIGITPANQRQEKTTEYREVTPYWSKRLEGRHYDVIQFRNGYAKIAPTMIVEFKGMGIVTFQTTPTYAIELGKIGARAYLAT